MEATQLQEDLESRDLALVEVRRDSDFAAWNRIKTGLHSKDPEVAAENKVRARFLTSRSLTS